MTNAAVYTHCFATIFMVGLIWFIQIVHYPMLADVGESDFVVYERIHQQRTTWVVMPVMLVELSMAAYLVFRPSAGSGAIPAWSTWIGLVLLLGVWATTFFLSVPCHSRLAQGFDAVVHQKLVMTNWLRTAGWTLRGLLAIWMVSRT